MWTQSSHGNGFTLIELSIVLVIIGLIVGGVLVGQNLIDAAAVRAQISQIEKYNTAANTFRGKYGYLPGDIPNPYAAQFGFLPRGTYKGQGDGNGVIQSITMSGGFTWGIGAFEGEQAMFWVDLSTAKLIDGTFSTATPGAFVTSTITGTTIDQYFPQAKINSAGHVFVASGGWSFWGTVGQDSINYFYVANVTGTTAASTGQPLTIPLMTVTQAYAIDKKMDDGMPQSGSVMAMDLGADWASGGSTSGNPAGQNNWGDYDQTTGGPITSATTNPWYDDKNGATTSQTCYSNGDTLQPEQYSVNVNGGNGVNCSLSFRFQ
jgi:prepilin-type N-terminal cleavage/methylation domain-containing protein